MVVERKRKIGRPKKVLLYGIQNYTRIAGLFEEM